MDSRTTAKEIAEAVLSTAREACGAGRLCDLLQTKGDKAATHQVKHTFGRLGLDMGFKICAADFSDVGNGDRVDGEWLYDMVWYEDDEDGLLKRQALVLESEWKEHAGVKHNTEVDGDFQKLVQARADVRVWVSTSHNSDMAREQIKNCKAQANAFFGSRPGDTYLFVINDWSRPDTVIEQFTVSRE